MNSCIFCKIVSRKAKAKIVYEDNLIIAFFDVNPANKGHTLIMPKNHYKNIYDIPDKELKRVIVTAKKLSIIYKKALKVKALNILHASGKAAQQSVFHFHIHLVPRFKNDRLNLWYKSKSNLKDSFDEVLKKVKDVMVKIDNI
ncbi:HIT family protein [Candidatus Woesearchaeota archaeon]|nr:HIT family protein [Candidatus Woesearchaeota archaeon]